MTLHFFDALETREPDSREQSLLSQLPALIEQAKRAPGWQEILKNVSGEQITSRAALADLPITRKENLALLQQQHLPFGQLHVTPIEQMRRAFMSPGPIFEAQGVGADWWRCSRALFALGLQRGDVLQNCFSYHFTPGAFLIEEGALHLGGVVIPAGPGQTEMQVQAMSALKASAYAGTPSFLQHIIKKAQDIGADISNLQKAMVSAEALPDSLRAWLQANGVKRVLQFYGTADLGVIAYETLNADGQVDPGLVLDESLILEVLKPGTGIPVSVGEVGEIVITSLNTQCPLIRFGTGDLTKVLPGLSSCGRTNTRIQGWMGRADQLTKVKGMFVHPQHVTQIIRRHSFIHKARLVVSKQSGQDVMTLACEVSSLEQAKTALETVINSIREITQLRGEIRWVEPGSLPADGILIEDARVLE
ncbi:phenylacetate--CoA ligase [Allopusillimonas ginsengisoli]|nr:phenylacetate--CoA ligase [Allopusillimonas ginsengisoli]